MPGSKYALCFALMLMCVLQAAAQGGIKSIDLKNFTYKPHCASDTPQSITVKNGEYSIETKMPDYTDRLSFTIFEISYGDLDADRMDEAVVLSVCNTGGTGNFSEGFIFKLQNDRPVLAARIPGGDRAYGGLRTARVANGVLTVERNDPGENGASCCPEFIDTRKYKLVNSKLEETGKPSMRPIVPTERVSFDPGTSGKSMTFNVAANEAKRFLVGARAGQRLSVSAGNSLARIRLLETARITEGINNFLAVLPETRDYTIEVTNPTGQDISVAMNIKIQ